MIRPRALHDRDADWAGNAEDPDAFSSTSDKNNDATIPAPPWGAVSPHGDETDQVIPYQFVEIALNLSALQIDPPVFCADVSTPLFKTRSAPSFTAELNLALYQFSIIPPPRLYFVRMQAVGEETGTRFRQTAKVLLVR